MLAQIIIATLGVAAIVLSQSLHPRAQRWASVLGLAGQPAWFYASYTGEQWGIFALSFVYTAAWAGGFYNYWLRKN